MLIFNLTPSFKKKNLSTRTQIITLMLFALLLTQSLKSTLLLSSNHRKTVGASVCFVLVSGFVSERQL